MSCCTLTEPLAEMLKNVFIHPLILANGADETANSCVQDPGPSNGEIPDALIGVAGSDSEEKNSVCGGVSQKGDDVKRGNQDDVVVVGVGDRSSGDRVVVLGEDEASSEWNCGLEIGGAGDEKMEIGRGDEEEDEDYDDVPNLIEDLI
ncbi:hypothetical protein IHE45_04G094000 [Dioscorea alata]|uniref:Uncharacterized protein n=1 Tax=Dioscorea alata TaxID=55571 RepID=A0ACB7WEX9_DIOAL|nr:hypothetical protein IHE45_04G094000 [Dioscorea alata]